MKCRIVRRELQSQVIFGRGFVQLPPLPVGRAANQMESFRVPQIAFRQLRFFQGQLRPMQIEIGIGQAKVSFTVLRIALERCLEVGYCGPRFSQIVQDIPAVHVSRDHVRIALQGLGKIRPRLLELSIVLVHITGEKREIRLF